MAKKKLKTPTKPSALTAGDKSDLSRILKKARAFKAYYSGQRKSGV